MRYVYQPTYKPTYPATSLDVQHGAKMVTVTVTVTTQCIYASVYHEQMMAMQCDATRCGRCMWKQEDVNGTESTALSGPF